MGLIKKLSGKASSAFNAGYRSAGGAVNSFKDVITSSESTKLSPGTYVKRKKQYTGKIPKAGREVEDAYKNPYNKSFGGAKRGGSRPGARMDEKPTTKHGLSTKPGTLVQKPKKDRK